MSILNNFFAGSRSWKTYSPNSNQYITLMNTTTNNGSYPKLCDVIHMHDDVYVFLYNNINNFGVYTVACDFSTNTKGTAVALPNRDDDGDGATPYANNLANKGLVKISNNTFIVAYMEDSDDRIRMIKCTLSGTTITTVASESFYDGGSSTSYSRGIHLAYDGFSNYIVAVFEYKSVTLTNEDFRAFSVNWNTMSQAGSLTNIKNNESIELSSLSYIPGSASKFLLCYADMTEAGDFESTILTLNTSTGVLSKGSTYENSPGSNIYGIGGVAFSTTEGVVIYNRANNDISGKYYTIATNAITIGSTQTVYNDSLVAGCDYMGIDVADYTEKIFGATALLYHKTSYQPSLIVMQLNGSTIEVLNVIPAYPNDSFVPNYTSNGNLGKIAFNPDGKSCVMTTNFVKDAVTGTDYRLEAVYIKL